MRNQKGMTLVEVLAALSITVFVLGAGIALFYSIMQLSNNSTLKYLDQSSIKTAMNQVAKHLSDSNTVIYYSSRYELRFHNGKEYKALLLDAPNLTIYDFSDDNNASNDASNFLDSAITPANNADQYTNPVLLSDRVQSVEYLLAATDTALAATPVQNGELLQINFNFQTTRVDVNGQNQAGTETGSMTIKLLYDATTQ